MLPFPVPRSRTEGAGCGRLHGASGKEASVRKRRTLSGALCSENQDVPGSSSSSTDSSSEGASLGWASGRAGRGSEEGLEEMCDRVLA